ncbi:MAG: RNA polymerase sigma factor [Phycisphaerales bacterium]|nr:RNA polymerase sigma factor [Phycisphaerales bacterium]
MTESTDREILAEIAAGELGRFDELVDRYKGRLLKYLYSRVREFGTAEDLAQEVFLKVFRSPPKGGDGTVKTWLFRVARNSATDYLRGVERRKRLMRLQSQEVVKEPTAAEMEEERLRVEGYLRELPVEQAEVVGLRVFGDLSIREIAQVTGVGVATVKSRMRYGLAKIAEILEKGREV